MHAIEESQWGQVVVRTWSELTPHQWECFRLALMESETELNAQGVGVNQSGTLNELVTELQTQGVRVEYSPVIMQTTAEMVVSIVVSKRDYKTDMLKYLPLYERKSRIFNTVLDVYDRDFRNLEQQLEVTERNIFLDTAIEALPIYERDLGIKPNRNLRYDQRREQISSRNRASFDQTTEETIKNVAAAFSNGEVEINKTSIPGVFEIKFVGMIGIPDNMEGLKQAIDIIIPAHLGITYTFIYNTWEVVNDQTWNTSSSFTWDGLRTWDGVSE